MTPGPAEKRANIEQLVASLAAMTDANDREIAQSLIEAILELHGAALDRMLHTVFDSGSLAEKLMREFAADPLVSGLLVLHNLHPETMETRVQRALARLSIRVESLTVAAGVVSVRLSHGSRQLQEQVRAVARDAAPDAIDIVVEPASQNGFVPLTALCGTSPLGSRAPGGSPPMNPPA